MKATSHRHSAGHEHEFEPMHGLPEMLPADEHILWQGAPDWRGLAVRAFHLRKLAVYFAVLLALRVGFVLADGGGVFDAMRALPMPMALAGAALGLVCLLAWLSARTTAYTITDKRVVMRIGIVLTLTFNLPFKRIAAAAYSAAPHGRGDIALTLAGSDRIAWLNLWPHARPWRVGRPEPALRCVPQGEQVARQLAAAWSAATGHTLVPAARAGVVAAPAPRPARHAAARVDMSPT